MDYVKKFLHVKGTIGQGAFGKVLVTSPIQNQTTQAVQPLELTNRHISPPINMSSHLATQRQSPIDQSESQALMQQQETDQNTSPLINSSGKHKQKITTKLADTSNPARFALKCVHPILKPQRLASELRHLRDLGAQCNVVQMHTAHFHKGSLFIVMELIEHDRFVEIVDKLDYNEIVIYMKNLLISLEHVHAHNIMHRDIKPANFLFSRKDKKFLLVDFGLAQTIRARSALFGNRPIPASATANYATPISLQGTPTTPTSTSKRLVAPIEPFSNKKEPRLNQNYNQIRSNIPLSVNLNKSTHIINQSPARPHINLKPAGSPSTPNVSTKRHLPEGINNSNDINLMMLKRLRVSNDEHKASEPVRLTVGAYESPVTHNDSETKRIVNNNHKFSTPTIPSRRTIGALCDCRGKPTTCSTCLSRPESNAPKSGTPGFKAPEILLRYHHQTTAIDVWSSGVIFACLLSGHSPFFRDIEDTGSLAEIITILGSQKVTHAARALGIRLSVEPKREPVDLAQLCRTIRQSNKEKRQIDFPDEAFDLLNRMLDPNPMTRITASEALKHAWFNPMTEV